MPKVIIAGCGFLGEAAADLFFKSGWKVLGLCATDESAQRLAHKDYEVRVQNITEPFTIKDGWHGADALIHCASTGGGDAEAYRLVYLEGLLNLMAAFQPRRSLFTSSTSVYTQIDGSVVDEESPAEPTREKGLILRDAEAVALVSGGYVARLSGLYGPGRSILLEKMLDGTALIEEDGSRRVNQIHRHDAAAALYHIFSQRIPPGIYNVTDNTPAPQAVLYGWLGEVLSLPLPGSHPRDLNRKRGWTNKQVSNAKLRATRWEPVFASYRESIPSLLDS